LEVGNSTTLALIQKMIAAEDGLLKDPKYISYGVWPVQSLSTQLLIHRDAQKFLLRSYGLTLSQTARSDFVNVTQDIYLNMPGKYEYFDTIAWGLANAVWFASYDRSQLPLQSDFASALRDLNLHYNLTAARIDSANPFIDYSRLLHYIAPLEYTDGYFRLEGDSLNQTYQGVQAQLAQQLLSRQLPNGNVSSTHPFKAYLVEDYARDLDGAYYLNHDSSYVSAAFRSETFITGLYLQPDGNITLPRTGQGFDPIVAYHLISIADHIRSASVGDWSTALSQASRIVNYTMSIQSTDGTFRFYTNTTNPGFAYSTISAVSAIVDTSTSLRSPDQTTTTATQVTTQSLLSTSSSGNGQSTQLNSPGVQPSIPSWILIMAPVALLVVASVIYEAKHRNRYRGLVGK
jgi:hypothetical protein